MRLKTPKVFDEKTFNKLINEVSDISNTSNEAIRLASLFSSSSIENNPNCCIIKTILNAFESKNELHTLKSTPKYWIVLRKSGGGLLSEFIPCLGGLWNDKYVGFTNESGTLGLEATILLFK